MKLYDFSVYAERRNAILNEDAARAAVREAMGHIEEPGAIIQLKQKVDGWFTLHRDVAVKVANVK